MQVSLFSYPYVPRNTVLLFLLLRNINMSYVDVVIASKSVRCWKRFSVMDASPGKHVLVANDKILFTLPNPSYSFPELASFQRIFQ
ncbi:hypothetical protein TNIN_343511 [Trichonephila inaurata madagascariensis]|uniref:Uncharacterized protein n=1 Tax=Trichonephila inaurata madagascariensis TaxID=2747483 RepID=A0A8X6X6Y2_9ARAC|nr:hypothetical protein TNIN_343511 [Trichonephila inaurata madagascariensis]